VFLSILNAIAAIPSLISAVRDLVAKIEGWNLEARLNALEGNHAKLTAAYDLLNKAKTTEEKANAADAIAAAFNNR
jgi:hypothetical protein